MIHIKKIYSNCDLLEGKLGAGQMEKDGLKEIFFMVYHLTFLLLNYMNIFPFCLKEGKRRWLDTDTPFSLYMMGRGSSLGL